MSVNKVTERFLTFLKIIEAGISSAAVSLLIARDKTLFFSFPAASAKIFFDLPRAEGVKVYLTADNFGT